MPRENILNVPLEYTNPEQHMGYPPSNLNLFLKLECWMQGFHHSFQPQQRSHL